MINLTLRSKGFQILFGLAIVFCLFATVTETKAVKPDIPYLSLTGTDGGYDDNWYPDGRIWLPPSANGDREFLLPVFIDNRWYTDSVNFPQYKADPIYSFQFKVLYDSSALRAIGVQKTHPITEEHFDQFGWDPLFEWYEPLGQRFNISWDDRRDFSYRTILNPDLPRQDYERGRGVTITGTSSKPLPVTSTDGTREWKVLLYVKFRVVPTIGTGIGVAGNTPIIISNDTIRYNDLIVTKNAPFENQRAYDDNVQEDYNDPTTFTGIEGMTNEDKPVPNQVEPVRPGTIYLRIMDELPEFHFELNRGIGSQPPLFRLDDDLWNMIDPITLDSNSFDPIFGLRTIQVINSTSTSRMNDVIIESNAPWLLFRTVPVGTNSKQPNPINRLTRAGRINYMDNGILGNDAIKDPRDNATNPDGEVHLEIACDPSELNLGDTEDDPEKTGVYVGYITFQSPFAEVSPVRLRVTFIYFRNPLEGNRAGSIPGIELFIRNSSGQDGDKVNLVFGTGHRATDNVDTLFGEHAYDFPINGFGARFFPLDKDGNHLTLYGLGDFNANDEENRTVSRDIRSNRDTLESIIYLVRFDANGDQNYPIVIEWDILDFPDGSELFIRDTLNGQLFPAVNMREATVIGTTRRSFIIQDPNITSFIIEYTLPKVIEYLDEFGNPIIKKGWNLLSLPVKPTNTLYTEVYENAINRPYYFSQNQYQDVDLLQEGVGYFIKYGDLIDTRFAGTYIGEISLQRRNAPRLYPGDADNGGWNTIGACSTPLNIEEIDFDLFNGEQPTLSYVKSFGVWGYTTDRGYKEVSELMPGLGYWIKVDNNGYLRLIAPRNIRQNVPANSFIEKQQFLANSIKINVMDNAQHNGTIYMTNNDNAMLDYYELPPAPPAGLFDIRYLDNKIISNENESVFNLQGVRYPLTISMENTDAEYIFTDAITGKELGVISPVSGNSFDILGETSNRIMVERLESLETGVYPNPVNENSRLVYSIPAEGFAKVALYDELGNEVMIIASGNMNAGVFEADLDASELRSGNYFIKVASGNFNEVIKVTVIK